MKKAEEEAMSLNVCQLKKNKKGIGIKIIVTFIIVILISTTAIMATNTSTDEIIPLDSQYFELRAVEVRENNSQKQLIMQLWGHDIKFKRI